MRYAQLVCCSATRRRRGRERLRGYEDGPRPRWACGAPHSSRCPNRAVRAGSPTTYEKNMPPEGGARWMLRSTEPTRTSPTLRDAMASEDALDARKLGRRRERQRAGVAGTNHKHVIRGIGSGRWERLRGEAWRQTAEQAPSPGRRRPALEAADERTTTPAASTSASSPRSWRQKVSLFGGPTR